MLPPYFTIWLQSLGVFSYVSQAMAPVPECERGAFIIES